jgi:hypothetical protein
LKSKAFSVSHGPEKPRRLRRVGRAIKGAASTVAFAGWLLFEGLMLAGGKAYAGHEQPQKGLVGRVTGGVYEKGETPFLGFGASGHLGFERVRMDAVLDVFFPNFGGAELDHAELDITFPINQYFAFTPFVYRSEYYGGVPLGAGVAFHIPKLDLHAAPHWIRGKDAVPLPISWTPSIGDGRLKMKFQIMVQMRHIIASEPGPFIGGEVKASFRVVDGIYVYGRTWCMTARNAAGEVSMGAASAQAGVEWEF